MLQVAVPTAGELQPATRSCTGLPDSLTTNPYRWISCLWRQLVALHHPFTPIDKRTPGMKGGQETALLLSFPMDGQQKLSPADLRPLAFVLSTQTEHPQRS